MTEVHNTIDKFNYDGEFHDKKMSGRPLKTDCVQGKQFNGKDSNALPKDLPKNVFFYFTFKRYINKVPELFQDISAKNFD